MTSKILFMSSRNNFKLMISLVVTILFALTPIAKADYVPPSDQKPPSDYTKSTGIRGGEQTPLITFIPLTLLAPQTYIGYTTSQRPTFAWYVPDLIKNKPCKDPRINPKMEFSMYDYDPNGNIQKRGKSVLLPVIPGITRLQFPEEEPELLIGKTYVWQVAIFCQTPDKFANETEIYLTAADVEVVGISDNLLSKITATENPLEKAEIYGEAGLWYDALAQILLFNQDSKLGEIGAKFIDNLADSEELKEPEKLKPDYLKRITEKIANLREIARQEKNK